MTAPNRTFQAHYAMLARWHFYASIFVMPLLLILTLTGLVYLYKAQIEAYLYADQLYVTPSSEHKKSLQELYQIAQQHLPNKDFVVEVHDAPNRSAQFIYRDDTTQGKSSLFIDPYTGEVLANMPTLKQNATYFVGIARQIHRNLLSGQTGHIIMELASCWTLIMIITGWGLWWLKKSHQGFKTSLLPQKNRKGRFFWIQWHRFIGLIFSIGIVFFVLTGMPWTSLWGKQFKSMVASVDLGFPPIPSAVSDQHEEHLPTVVDDLPIENKAWSAGLLPIPQSQQTHQHPITLDDVVKIAHTHHIYGDFSIALPKNKQGVYTVSFYPPDPTLEKVLNIDQYTGQIINQLSYDEYGAIAKIIEHGVYIHLGTYFGTPNQLICTFIALALLFITISGFIIWKQRKHALFIPSPLPHMTKWLIGLALLGLIFPPAGISMLLVYVLDQLYLRLRKQ